jgi:hypothetical protein
VGLMLHTIAHFLGTLLEKLIIQKRLEEVRNEFIILNNAT